MEAVFGLIKCPEFFCIPDLFLSWRDFEINPPDNFISRFLFVFVSCLCLVLLFVEKSNQNRNFCLEEYVSPGLTGWKFGLVVCVL